MARAEDPARWGARLRPLLPVLAVVAVMLPLRAAVADWNDVPTSSMRPTILEGERIVVNKLAYGLRVPLTHRWLARWDAPARGDIVTLASPRDGKRLVKRIVGLPGDRVSMRDNRLVVNGRTLDYRVVDATATGRLPDGREAPAVIAEEALPERPHAVAFTLLKGAPSSFAERVVPEGAYFFLGDNRDMSLDSRAIGTAPLEHVYGRVTHVAFSVDPEDSYRPRFARWFSALR